MRHRDRARRVLGTLLVLALSASLTAALTTGVATATAPSAAVGVDTATNTVKVAVIGLNLQSLVDAGVVPDLGQNTDLFDVRYTLSLFGSPWLSGTLQHWAFWLLFIGFIIKVPSVPLHTLSHSDSSYTRCPKMGKMHHC